MPSFGKTITFFILSEPVAVPKSRKRLVAPECLNVLQFEGCRLVKMEGNQKLCAFCRDNKIKSPRGYWVYTRKKCSQCKVPLCKAERGCFYLYHKAMAEGRSHIYRSTSEAIADIINVTQFTGGHVPIQMKEYNNAARFTTQYIKIEK